MGILKLRIYMNIDAYTNIYHVHKYASCTHMHIYMYRYIYKYLVIMKKSV